MHVLHCSQSSTARQVVAIKCVTKASLNRVSTENLLTEIELLKTLRHEHIVELKDFEVSVSISQTVCVISLVVVLTHSIQVVAILCAYYYNNKAFVYCQGVWSYRGAGGSAGRLSETKQIGF